MATNHTTTHEIGIKTMLRVVLVFVACWAALKLQSLIFYLLFATLFAVALSPLVNWFERKGFKRGTSLAFVLSIVVGVLFAILGIITASLVGTVNSFVKDLPSYLDGLRQYEFLREPLNNIEDTLNSINLERVLQQSISSGGVLLASASKAFEATLFTFFFTVYMLLERDYILRLVRGMIPKSWSTRTHEIEKEFIDVVGGYIRGQLITSFLVALSAYIIMRILHIPNALALAIIAAMFDIIPVIGGLIGLIPVVLVALTISPVTAVLAVVLMQTYSTLSNYFIMPRVFGASLEMSPFIVTIATMSGLLLFGIPGIILALPTAAMVGYILTNYYGIPVLPKDDK